MKIYLEFREGSSSKFWSVEVEGDSHTVTYGKIGSAGRSKQSEFASNDDATADAEKQADKKRKKGYSDAVEAAASAKAEPKASAKASAAKAPKKKAPKPKAAKAKKPPSSRTLKSFYKAMRAGDLGKVRAELERAIDANIAFDIQEDGEPWPALYYAVFHNQVGVADVLLDAGADANAAAGQRNTLHVVRDATLAKRLVDGGADPNYAPQGYAPLHYVRTAAIAQVLIDAGAEVDAETPKGLTPFESTMDVDLRKTFLGAGAKGLRQTQGEPFEVSEEEVPFEGVNAQRGKLGVGAEDSLWVGTYEGLYRVAGGETTRYVAPGYPATTAIARAHGSTYIATNQGLLRFQGGTFTQYTPNNSPLHDAHIVQMAVLHDEVWCVGYEKESKRKHVSAFDGQNWRLLEPGKDLPECAVQHLMIDAAGRYTLSSPNDGIYVQQADTNEWVEQSIAEGIFAPKVYVMNSHDGVDYFGTHMGLFRRAGESFEKMQDGAFSQLAWIGTTLWAATNWDGVFAFDDPQSEGAKAEVYDEARAGHSLSNVESMTAVGDDLYLIAGGELLRMRDGAFTPI